MKCRVCEGEEISGNCCVSCWTQHCPVCGKITYSEEDYHDSQECLCDHLYGTVDGRLHLTIGYLEQVLSGIVSSFVGVFGAELVEYVLQGVLKNMENIRHTHLEIGRALLDDKNLGRRIIGERQTTVNYPNFTLGPFEVGKKLQDKS